MEIVTIVGNRAYSVTFTAEESAYAEHSPDARDTIASLEML
jgi:hypothetical protein